MSIVVFIWACAAFCLSSSLLRQLDPDLQVLKKRGGKVFFSDSKFLPFYPPTDTVPFNTRDNFIHLYIIVSNSIGKLLQHASELDRAVMSSFFLNAMSFLSQSFQAQNKHCNKKNDLQVFPTLLFHHGLISLFHLLVDSYSYKDVKLITCIPT